MKKFQILLVVLALTSVLFTAGSHCSECDAILEEREVLLATGRTDDELTLYFFINAEHMITIPVDEVDGVYQWWYVNEDDYYREPLKIHHTKIRRNLFRDISQNPFA